MRTMIGVSIKEFRLRKRLSQLELEVIISASPGSISRIENGKINPSKETILKIAKALDLNCFETASLFGIEIPQPSYPQRRVLNV